MTHLLDLLGVDNFPGHRLGSSSAIDREDLHIPSHFSLKIERSDGAWSLGHFEPKYHETELSLLQNGQNCCMLTCTTNRKRPELVN